MRIERYIFILHLKKWHEKTPEALRRLGFSDRHLFRSLIQHRHEVCCLAFFLGEFRPLIEGFLSIGKNDLYGFGGFKTLIESAVIISISPFQTQLFNKFKNEKRGRSFTKIVKNLPQNACENFMIGF